MKTTFANMRRRTLGVLGLAMGLSLVAGPAMAAEYPSRTVRFVVPYAAGGLPDTVARVMAQQLGEELGVSFVVDNRPGANGVVAATTLLNDSAADGYNFLVTDGSMLSINPHLYNNLSYDPQKDFVPVSQVATSPLFLAAHIDFPANTLEEFIELVKANPGKFDYGSSGVGSSHQLSMEALKAAKGLDITHVPFRGSGQSVPALVGNQVPVVFSALPSLVGFVDNKQVKLLAVNSGERYALTPEVPSIAEVVPGYDFAVTVGILAPKGTPQAAIDRIAEAAAKVVKKPAVIETMSKLGIDPVGAMPAEYAAAIQAESERSAAAIKAAGIKPE